MRNNIQPTNDINTIEWKQNLDKMYLIPCISHTLDINKCAILNMNVVLVAIISLEIWIPNKYPFC